MSIHSLSIYRAYYWSATPLGAGVVWARKDNKQIRKKNPSLKKAYIPAGTGQTDSKP